MFKVLTLSLALTACGEALENAKEAKDLAKEDKNKGGTVGETDTAQPSSTTDDLRQNALYIEDVASRPECTAEDEGWLVYIVALESFQVCSRSKWKDIELHGKDGKDGTNGIGVDGKDGLNGEDGEDAYANSNAWYDDATETSWIYVTGLRYEPSDNICVGGYRLPSVVELKTAIDYGVIRHFKLMTDQVQRISIWTSEYATIVNVSMGEYVGSQTLAPAIMPSAVHHVFCVKEEGQ